MREQSRETESWGPVSAERIFPAKPGMFFVPFDSVNTKYLMYCIFPVLKPLAYGRQSRRQGWTYKLPGGQKFSIKLSPLSLQDFHREHLEI